MNKVVLVLLLALMVSGCTGFPDLSSIFGGGQKVKEEPEDVIVVEDLTVMPPSSINADDEFSVSFNIANVDETDNVDVGYRLLDSGLCYLLNSLGGFCSGGQSCYPLDEGSCSGRCTQDSTGCCWDPYGEVFPGFVPGQVEFVEWTFRAPKNEQIGYLSTRCPIRFIIGYDYQAASEIEVNVITDDRYEYLKQSGEFETFTPTLVLGRGPIKIHMELGVSLPVRTGKTVPFYVTVEDKGSGLLEEIGANNLTIKTIGPRTPDCGSRFTCTGNTCSNTEPIIMISRKSPTIKCNFTAPSNIDLERTYFIDAIMDYSYRIVEETSIDVNPSPA